MRSNRTIPTIEKHRHKAVLFYGGIIFIRKFRIGLTFRCAKPENDADPITADRRVSVVLRDAVAGSLHASMAEHFIRWVI